MGRLAWSSATRVLERRAARTADRATRRRLSYAPDLDGSADPGEVVWATVTFEEDATRAKDRPLLVVGRKDDETVLALMLSTQLRRARDRDWVPLGRGAWDGQGRRSFARLDRVLELHENDLRREGAVLRRDRFDEVCAVLRTRHGWE